MRIEQIRRYLAYAQLAKLSLKKLANIIRVESRLLFNNPDMKGIAPFCLFVDISNACNLRCPLCQMGQRKTAHRENRMTLENYSQIIAPVKDRLFQVFLYNWGEPFLNREIYGIIRHNTSNNISTIVSSNLNLPVDAEQLVRTGCEYLIVSADGATQDVYEKYRVGGNLQTVIDQVRLIAKAKRDLKSTRPFIEWQCLVSRYNEATLDQVKKIARDAGADTVRFANLNFFSAEDDSDSAKEWAPQNPLYQWFSSTMDTASRTRKPCFWLWRTAIVNADGGLTPCCLYDVPSWADAFNSGILEAWNSPLFTEARERSLRNPSPRTSLICDRCTAPFIYK